MDDVREMAKKNANSGGIKLLEEELSRHFVGHFTSCRWLHKRNGINVPVDDILKYLHIRLSFDQ